MRLLPIAVCLLVLTGCARVAAVSHETTAETPVSGKGALLPGSDLRASGFLGDYSLLKPVPDGPNLWRYVAPGVNWKQYSAVYVAPIEVWISPEAEYPGIQPGVFVRLDTLFRKEVAAQFSAHGYQIAERPGPGVLVFHGAVTGVTPKHQGLEPSDALPIKAVVNLGRHATGLEPYYIVLSGEIEVLDGSSGQRVFAAVGARRGYQTTTKDQPVNWEELQDTFAWVAARWREQLDKARGA